MKDRPFTTGSNNLFEVIKACDDLANLIRNRKHALNMRDLISEAQATIYECSKISRAASDLADWLKSVEKENHD